MTLTSNVNRPTRSPVDRMRDVLRSHVDRGDVPGLAWLVARAGKVDSGAEGVLDAGGDRPVERDSIFRIASMTKPVTAVAALILVEECRLRLDDPVDPLLPELADRRVLARSDGPLDDTVPAARPITLRDLLTFRVGLGYDFGGFENQRVVAAMAELELGVGPPAPAGVPEPDEWMRRLGTLPLERQPGERWLYHTGSEILGVLVARAAGQPLEAFLHERIFEPLGMHDTGFWVPPSASDRFGSCRAANPETGEPFVYDTADGQWSAPPAFPSGGGGLVSTLDDYLAFAAMLHAGGMGNDTRILSSSSVAAMTTNHLTPEQLAASSPDPSGTLGWGFGVGVQLQHTGPARTPGTYGWSGGLGTSWSNDPDSDLIGILLTNQAWTSPTPPPVCLDFWTCAYTLIDG